MPDWTRRLVSYLNHATKEDLQIIHHVESLMDTTSALRIPIMRSALLGAYQRCEAREDVERTFSTIKSIMRPPSSYWTKIIASDLGVDDFTKALSRLEEMRSLKIEPDGFAWNEFVEYFRRKGQLVEGAQFLTQMSRGDQKPSRLAWIKLIFALGKAQYFDEELAALHQVLMQGFHLEVKEWSIIMDSLARGNRLDLIMQVYPEMKKAGVEPDTVLWTILIAAAAKQRHPDLTQALIKEALACASPTESLWNTILTATSKIRHYQDTITHFNAMRAKFPLQQQTWAIGIHAYGQLGQIDDMISLFDEMRSRGITPDVITWGSIITNLANAKRTEVMEIIDKVRELFPSNSELESVINQALKKMGKPY